MDTVLNSGNRMPTMIYGTYKIANDQISSALSAALSVGFRHIDTASMYLNEEGIGNFISTCSYPRESLFITTKAWPSQYRDLEKACDGSLRRLKTPYLDLYLLHWPLALKQQDSDVPIYSPGSLESIDRYPLYLAWRQMEQLQRSGKVRSIGVSNWNCSLLNDLLSYAEIPPACNQFETHLYNPKTRLVDFCNACGVKPIGYRIIFAPAPDSKYEFKESGLNDEVVNRLAAKYNKSSYQIVIRWNLQRGCGVVVKSSNLGRIQENWQSKDFEIEPEDMRALNDIKMRGTYTNTVSMFGLEIE